MRALACVLAAAGLMPAGLPPGGLAAAQGPDPVASWVVFRAFSRGQPVLDLTSEEIEVRVDGLPVTVGDVEVVKSSGSHLAIIVDEDFMLELDRFLERSVGALLAEPSGRARFALASTRPGGVRVWDTDNPEVLLAGIGRLTFGSGAFPECPPDPEPPGLLSAIRALLTPIDASEVPTVVVFTGTYICGSPARDSRVAQLAEEIPAFYYVIEVPGVDQPDAIFDGLGSPERLADALDADHIRLPYPSDDRMRRILRDTATYYRVRADPSGEQPFPQHGRVTVAVSRSRVEVRSAGRLRALPRTHVSQPSPEESP
jgi:hypothetical protein